MFRKMFEEYWQWQKRWDKYIGSGEYLRVVLYLLIGGILSLPLTWPTNTLSYNKGMGADSDGRVYIGEKQWIGVYENGELVDKFVQRVIGNDFEFAVIDDQIHLWDLSSFRKILDLQGNEVDEVYDKHASYVLSYKEKHEFTAEDGRFYKLENGLLKRAKVTCYYPDGSEEIVFQMPLGLYLAKLAFFAYLAALVLWLGRSGFCYMKKYWHPERHDK